LEITVEFISGDYQGKKYRFSSDTVTVGRSPECDLSLESDTVSYEHCRFSTRADGLYLTDLGSTNGTYVNGSRHDSGFIADGDKVVFGEGGPEATVSCGKSSRAGKAKAHRAADKTQMVQVSSKNLTLKVKGGKRYDFPQGVIKIGREEDCDITIDHSLVSREHAEISFYPPEMKIRDLNSTNGTYLNGKRVTSSSLQEGDVISIGDNGPEIVVGMKARRRSGASKFFKALIPIILILVVLAAAYQFAYAPWAEKRRLANLTLTEYVTHRLDSLSVTLGDAQDEIPLIFVESVVKYINSFTGKQRDWFESSLERSREHIGMVRRLLRGAGLPEEFAYLAFVESGYNAAITSGAGARGLWQFMPATARDFGLKVEGNIDERTDPKKSTEAACKYIKQLYNLYNSYMLAMASYNTGENRIARALRKIDVIEQNRFWYLVKKDMLHDETIGYVPKIMAAMIIATDPKKFEFESETEEQ
jgi:pSer/pThr/pTyr-binding forkhead associated (FHA) protein